MFRLECGVFGARPPVFEKKNGEALFSLTPTLGTPGVRSMARGAQWGAARMEGGTNGRWGAVGHHHEVMLRRTRNARAGAMGDQDPGPWGSGARAQVGERAYAACCE